jgi:glycosyltransferase involved in cell wall biosynthesis
MGQKINRLPGVRTAQLENKKISIIVPVYNAENYLHKCIDSILSQTFIHFECILVDDCSDDGSPKICDEYSHKDKRIRVIHNKKIPAFRWRGK